MPEPPRRDHFPLFDSLRAIAALLVFGIHSTYQIDVTRGEAEWWYRFGAHLDVAVPIFFGISGFLLWRPFVRARVRGRRLDLRAYGWRRFLRIVPGYWVALTGVMIWFGLPEVRESAGRLLQFYAFGQIYDKDTVLSGLGQAWTLDVEVAYYALLPLLTVILLRAGRRREDAAGRLRLEWLLVAAVLGFSLAWKVGVLAVTDAAALASGPLLYPLPTWLDHLGMGMALAVASVGVTEGIRSPGRAIGFVERRAGWVWGGALGLWLVACAVGPDGVSGYTSDPTYLARHVLYSGTVLLLLAPAVFGRPGHGLVRRFLGWRFLVWVGTISYSFYLWHYAALRQQAEWWGRIPQNGLEWILWVAGALAFGLAIGALGYRFVEKPFMDMKDRMPFGRRAPKEPEAESAQAHAAP